MRWKTDSPRTAPATAEAASGVSDSVSRSQAGPEAQASERDRIRADLEARGIEAPAESLIGHVQQELARSRAPYTAVLDAVAVGFRAQHALAEQLAKSAGELQEIERLMGSFASELSKLDEVLEVLAAYLRRMRTALPQSGARVLH